MEWDVDGKIGRVTFKMVVPLDEQSRKLVSGAFMSCTSELISGGMLDSESVTVLSKLHLKKLMVVSHCF